MSSVRFQLADWRALRTVTPGSGRDVHLGVGRALCAPAIELVVAAEWGALLHIARPQHAALEAALDARQYDRAEAALAQGLVEGGIPGSALGAGRPAVPTFELEHRAGERLL